MNENRLQAPMLSIVALLFLLLCAPPSGGRGQEVGQRTDQSLQALLSQLASGDEEHRIDAAVRIGALLHDERDVIETSVIKPLVEALQHDPAPIVRALAARALEICAGNQGGQNGAAAPGLLAALGKEQDLAARKAIIYALARYPRPQVTSALIPFLKNKRSELRAAAAYALAEIGDPSSAEALAEVLRRGGKDEDAFARSQAARGLGRLGVRDSIDLLTSALTGDKSEDVRRESAISLGKI